MVTVALLFRVRLDGNPVLPYSSDVTDPDSWIPFYSLRHATLF